MDLIVAHERWKIADGRAPRTAEGYLYSLRRLARFGIKTTEDCEPKRLSEYVLWRIGTSSPTSTKLDLAALFSTLSYLTRSEEFPDDQLRRLRKLRIRTKAQRRFSARFLSRDEIERLVAAAKKPRTKFMIRIAVLSGLRAGELCRLRWEDCDLAARAIRVPILPELGQAGRIKTGHERKVPMCAELRAAIEEARATIGTDRTFIFLPTKRTTKRPHARVQDLRRELERARKIAGIPDATFHVLRHSRASAWTAGGVSLAKVSAWLGHTPEVCAKYYAGLQEGYDPDCERTPAA